MNTESLCTLRADLPTCLGEALGQALTLVSLAGFEPATFALGERRSVP